MSENHPDTLSVENDLAVKYRKLSKFEESDKFALHVVTESGHLETALTMCRQLQPKIIEEALDKHHQDIEEVRQEIERLKADQQ